MQADGKHKAQYQSSKARGLTILPQITRILRLLLNCTTDFKGASDSHVRQPLLLSIHINFPCLSIRFLPSKMMKQCWSFWTHNSQSTLRWCCTFAELCVNGKETCAGWHGFLGDDVEQTSQNAISRRVLCQVVQSDSKFTDTLSQTSKHCWLRQCRD